MRTRRFYAAALAAGLLVAGASPLLAGAKITILNTNAVASGSTTRPRPPRWAATAARPSASSG